MPGCVTEELRVYTQRAVLQLESSVAELLKKTVAQDKKILELQKGKENDLKELKEVVKTLDQRLGQPALDAATHAMSLQTHEDMQRAMAMLEKVSREAKMSEHQLRTELSAFAANLAEHVTQLDQFEGVYRKHITNK